MKELKERIHDNSNGLDYVLAADYYIPEDIEWHSLFGEALQKRDYVEYLSDTLLTGTEAEKAAVAGLGRNDAPL